MWPLGRHGPDRYPSNATRIDRSWSLIGRFTAPILKKVSSELLTVAHPRPVRLRHEGLVPVDEKDLFGRSSRADGLLARQFLWRKE